MKTPTLDERIQQSAQQGFSQEEIDLLKQGKARALWLKGKHDHLRIIVDAEDYNLVSRYNLYLCDAGHDGFVVRGRPKNSRQGKALMHIGRIILGLSGRFPTVEYRDGNPFVNLKANIRVVK